MSLTVVVPNYNHGHLIGRQLNAVFSQSLPPEKVLIFDDASTDDSVERIRALIAGHRNAELIQRERNAGVIAAMNEGVSRATTEYVAFLAADDEVLPGFCEKSVTVLDRYPQAAFSSAISRIHVGGGRWTAVPLPPAYPCRGNCFIEPARAAELLLDREHWYVGTTVVHRRRMLAEIGFRAGLRSFTDGFVYLTMALRHGACFIPEELAAWHRDARGYSSATSRNDAAMAAILQLSQALMSTEFSAVYPPKLRQRILGRLRFRAAAAGRGRLAQALLFARLRWYDIPLEVRTRFYAGRIAQAQ